MSTAAPGFNNTLEIGGTGALGSESGWEVIGGLRTMTPTFGDKWATVDATAFGDAVRQNLKTIRDPDMISCTFNRIFDDAGQNAARDAAANGTTLYDYNFRFKVKDGAGTLLETYTFKGRVMTFTIGAANPAGLNEGRLDIEVVSAFTVV